MKILPNTKRNNIIFRDLQSASGFFAAMLLSLFTVVSVASYACDILFPEVSGGIVNAFAFVSVLFTALVYLFSAEWIAYPAAAVMGTGMMVLFVSDMIVSLKEKISVISVEIYNYSPEYYLGRLYEGDIGLTVAVAALTAVCGVTVTHFLARCKITVPVITVTALTAGIFICLERNDSIHFYMCILCVIAMLCIAAQAKAGKAMGATLAVTKIGTKTAAFFLAALLVLMPIASNESFSKSVMDAVSQLTGIKPPSVSPGGFGDASGDVSWEGLEQYLNDLESRQSKTDLEDLEFQNVLMYMVSGAADNGDIYFRRRIYGDYYDSAWTLDTSTSSDLTDSAMKNLYNALSLEYEVETPALEDNFIVYTASSFMRQNCFLEIAAIQDNLYIPVAAGTPSFTGAISKSYFDVDKDGVKEEYPSYGMITTRITAYDSSDAEWYEILKYVKTVKDEIDPDPEYISGNEELDYELKALAIKILKKYGGFSGYQNWCESEYPVLDAIKAIQTYLTYTKYYTMNPQMSDRYENYDHSKDSIYNFLFNTGEGYCVQFASTAVLLLRSLGIEARYVTGYSSRSADSNGYRSIYDSDSHAWCEVNIAGLGWIPFEMTYGAMVNSITAEGPVLDLPTFPDESSQPDESSEDISDEISDESSEDISDEISEISDESGEDISALPDASAELSEGSEGSQAVAILPVGSLKAIVTCVITALCVVIIVLICAYIHRRCEKRRKQTHDFRLSCSAGTETPGEALIKLHTQHIEMLTLMGYKPMKAEKYGEYAARIHRSDPDMPNPVHTMKYFEKAEFGGTPTSDELKAAGAHLLALNDYTYLRCKGIKKNIAYFKGVLTKPNLKKEDK